MMFIFCICGDAVRFEARRRRTPRQNTPGCVRVGGKKIQNTFGAFGLSAGMAWMLL
jgi:hypothetical protein